MKLLMLLILTSVASSEKEKEETNSKIGQEYDLFYQACECLELT